MPSLRRLPGFMILEAALESPAVLLPGGLSCSTYAETLATSVFGTSLAELYPRYPRQDASEDEFQRYYDAHASALELYECEWLNDAEALRYFDRLGWDFSDSRRQYSKLGSIFGPLVEGMAKGWFGPSPLAEIEAWRRLEPELRGLSVTAANDTQWRTLDIETKFAE